MPLGCRWDAAGIDDLYLQTGLKKTQLLNVNKSLSSKGSGLQEGRTRRFEEVQWSGRNTSIKFEQIVFSDVYRIKRKT